MAKSKTAMAKATRIPSQTHHLPQGLQYAETVEVFEFETKKGKDMEIYTLALDGKRDHDHLFKLFERPSSELDEGFKLELGDILVPKIRVAAGAYLDNRGQARPQNITVIEWVKSTGEITDDAESSGNSTVNEEQL